MTPTNPSKRGKWQNPVKNEVRKITHIIINYLIAVHSNPLTIKCIIAI